MSFIDNWIKDQYHKRGFDKLPPLEPAKIYGEITKAELWEIMPSWYTDHYGQRKRVRITVLDNKWRLTSIEEIHRFLKWHKNAVKTLMIDRQWIDCDDKTVVWMKSFSLWVLWGHFKEWTSGLCAGMEIIQRPAPLTPHAKVFTLDYKKQVYEIESSNSNIEKQTSIITHYIA